MGMDQPSLQNSPLASRRGTRPPSTSNAAQQMSNFKRSADPDDHLQNSRKYPRLLTQALRDEIKIECQDHSIISPSTALAATRPLHQVGLRERVFIDNLETRSFRHCRQRSRRNPKSTMIYDSRKLRQHYLLTRLGRLIIHRWLLNPVFCAPWFAHLKHRHCRRRKMPRCMIYFKISITATQLTCPYSLPLRHRTTVSILSSNT